MGNTQDQGKLDEAIEAYAKLSIKPDYAELITTWVLPKIEVS